MRRKPLLGSCFALLVVTASCSSEPDSPTPSHDEPMTEPCDASFVCGVEGVPFVKVLIPSTDAWDPSSAFPSWQPPAGRTTATARSPEAGKVCMSGRVENGWAWLTLVFADFDASGWHDTLDATGLGIERIEFVVESPPALGISAQLVSGVPDCTENPGACQHWGFYLSGGNPPAPLVWRETQLVSASLAEFIRGSSIDPSWTFDPAHLTTLQIGPGFHGGTGDYDFCVSDLRFLDASGKAVLPSR